MTTVFSKFRYYTGILFFVPGLLVAFIGLTIGVGYRGAKKILASWGAGMVVLSALEDALEGDKCNWPDCTECDCACEAEGDEDAIEHAETYAENLARLDAVINAAPHLPITKEQ